MRKRESSLKLLSVVIVTSGLILCLQQSQACKRPIDEDITEQLAKRPKLMNSLKALVSYPHYGNFDLLPKDLLVSHILPQCDKTIIQVNRSFFTLVTGYSFEHIFDQGFENRPIKLGCSVINDAVVNLKHFSHDNIQQIPSFIWYSLIRHVKDLPSDYWLYLQGTQIQTVDLSYNQIDAMGAEKLGQSLQGTEVQTVNLSYNEIGDIGAEKFGQSLKDTQVQTVDLSFNMIENVGAEKFAQSLQGTQVQTVDLNYNDIRNIGAEKFGQYLKGTQVQSVNLSNNRIGDVGAEKFAQSLKDTQVQSVNLSSNNISNEGILIFIQILQETKVQEINLKNNRVKKVRFKK